MRNITINSYDMAFIEEGQGQPLLLVHGSLYDYRYWAPQISAFAAAGFHVFAPSLRHYWPNDAKGAARLSIEEHIADIATFIAALGLGPVDLLGHSRGGYIAFRVAERRPELLRRLALAEPAGVLGEGFVSPMRLARWRKAISKRGSAVSMITRWGKALGRAWAKHASAFVAIMRSR
jgi:pimeloyl-ACP methyl ester carboxylesterase